MVKPTLNRRGAKDRLGGASLFDRDERLAKVYRLSEGHAAFDYCPMKYPAIAIHVEVGYRSMQQRAVIPNDEIAGLPSMSVQESARGCKALKFFKQCSTRFRLHTHYVRYVRTKVEALPCGIRVGTHQRVSHRRTVAFLFLCGRTISRVYAASFPAVYEF